MKNSKGFGAVEALLIVVIVGLIGFVGWYVWDSKNNADSTYNNAANTQSNAAKVKTSDILIIKGNTVTCKGIFTVKLFDSLKASVNESEPPQCLISNVKQEELPPVGPTKPDQLALFFNIEKTALKTNNAYLENYVKVINETYPTTLKSQETLKLDNGKSAILTKLAGGHIPYDSYFFVYLKNGTAITTDFPVNAVHKDLAIKTLKSIN